MNNLNVRTSFIIRLSDNNVKKNKVSKNCTNK